MRMTIDSNPTLDDTQSCTAYRCLIDDIVAGELDATSMARAESHLARCADCRFAFAQARTYRRMMRRVGRGMRAPNSLRDRAVELMRAPRGPQP